MIIIISDNIEKEISILNNNDKSLVILKSLIDEFKPRISNELKIEELQDYEEV